MPEQLTIPAPTNPANPNLVAPPKDGGPLSTAWSDLDRYTGIDEGTPIPPKSTTPPPAKAEPPAAKEPPKEPPKQTTPAKEEQPKKETPKAEEPKPEDKTQQQQVKVKKPADFLREKLAKTEVERDSYRTELEKLKTASTEDPEKKTLKESLESASKRLQDLEEKLKYTDYSQSEEYNEKYHKPFEKAYNLGASKAMGFTVTDENGNERQSTQDDFDSILRMTDKEAAKEVPKLYGESVAPLIMWHRERILDLNTAKEDAKAEFRKTATERTKQMTAQAAERAQKNQQLWEKLNKEAVDKYPQWFKPTDGDEEGNKLLQDGFKMADTAFSGGTNLPPEKMVELHSAIRNRAAAFGRLVHNLKAKEAKIAELEKELEQYQNSEPTTGQGQPEATPEGPASTLDGVLSGLDKLARETTYVT